MFDVMVIGAGFSGSVLAERLATHGKTILLVDQRSHIGGNTFDYYDENGILVHKYGPHIFHTNNKEVIDYLSHFTAWRVYEHRVLASVDGQLVPIPINARTLELLYGSTSISEGVESFLNKVRVKVDVPQNAEESVLARMGPELYEKFFRGYTEKQWGRSPKDLNASVTARIPVRTNYDDRYFTDRYQLMPKDGYTALFQRMLSHPNIHILLQTRWEDVKQLHLAERLIFTGPIDSYFDHVFGRLPYRSLDFQLTLHHKEQVQEVGTINYPNSYDFTRITEMKHLTGQSHPYSLTITEYPRVEGDPYYPVPTPETKIVLQQYNEEAKKIPHVRFTGRLGSYQYYNMDQVVAASLRLCNTLIEEGW